MLAQQVGEFALMSVLLITADALLSQEPAFKRPGRITDREDDYR